MKAKFAEEFSVRHAIRPEVNLEFVAVDVPNGWDDVKKITNKVVLFDGRKFCWSGWNSDRNEAFFKRPLTGEDVLVGKFLVKA